MFALQRDVHANITSLAVKIVNAETLAATAKATLLTVVHIPPRKVIEQLA